VQTLSAQKRDVRKTDALERAGMLELPDLDQLPPDIAVAMAEEVERLKSAMDQIKMRFQERLPEATTSRQHKAVEKALWALDLIWERVTDPTQERVVLAEVAKEVGFTKYMLVTHVLEPARTILTEMFPDEVRRFSLARQRVGVQRASEVQG